MSAELRLLRAPGRTFRELAASSDRGAWTLLRRPLLLLFAMGLLLSLGSSGRLSVRTLADGMISFAFLPATQIAALAVVYLRGDRLVPFARVVDAFFVSHAPWLLWILVFSVWILPRTAEQMSTMSFKGSLVVVGSLVVPACWAWYLDLQFFRVVLPRASGRAGIDLLTQRVIAWTASLGYFFGIAAWAQVVAWLR